jgi:parvulin-like peptidyl-prolyl isomerase
VIAVRLLSFLMVILVAVVPAVAADSGSDVVARLGTTDITAAMLRNFVRTLDPAVRKQAEGDQALMAKLVRAELARMAVLKAAEAQKWDQRPEVIQQIQRVRDEAITSSYLMSVSAPPADYPSEADIQSAYDLNRDALMAPRQYRLSQIFVPLPAGADAKTEAAARQKADDMARKAKTPGTNFDALVKANADVKTETEQGGDLGWASEAEIVPEIRGQIAGLAQGEVGDPIRTASGWHIIRLDGTRPAGPRPLSEVREQLAAALRQRKMQANEQAYLNGLLAKSPIAVNEIGLKKIFENTQ